MDNVYISKNDFPKNDNPPTRVLSKVLNADTIAFVIHPNDPN
jgi:hypothetical protein